MINKKELLKDIRIYSPEQIAEAVRTGKVSMYELGKETEGLFTPLLKRQVKEILERPVQPDCEDSYETISLNSKTNASVELDNSIGDASSEISISEISAIVTLTSDVEKLATSSQNSGVHSITKNKPGMFSHPFSFKGRIRRTEYGLTMIINIFIYWIMNVLIISSENASSESAMGILILYFIILVPYLWFLWAQGTKRCHDRGNSGFFQLIPFYSFWMLFADGDHEPNEFGNSPK